MSYDNNDLTPINSTKAVVTNQYPKKNNGMAITSLVLGIMSCILCFSPMYSIITGLISLILAIISLIQKRIGYGLAIAGIITSVIGIILGGIFFILYVLVII
ncbi:MAG: DUF4190 domain-containing protein [Clostridium butyricum]|nr:DUF4190 domain-containing protein [Clostridium butyricum]